MSTKIHLHLVVSSDPELDCIVCRQKKVDREIVYGLVGGRASQGIHARCVGRAESVRPNRGIRRRRPDTGRTLFVVDELLRDALKLAAKKR